MNPIGNSLLDHLNQISLKTSINGEVSELKAFFPHHERFAGECPLCFSFDKDNSFEGPVEIKDGLAFLLPFLFSEIYFKQQEKLVLPPVARHFLPSKVTQFNYAAYEFKQEAKTKDCWIVFDYLSDLSNLEFLVERFQRVNQLASEFQNVKLLINHASGVRFNSDDHIFYQSIRSLPPNCQIISHESFYMNRDFNQSMVYFLTDPAFVLKSPWQEWVLTRNARVESSQLSLQDKQLLSIPLFPGVNKVIYQHVLLGSMDKALELELNKLFKMLKGPQSPLDKNYIRILIDLYRNRMESI